MSKTTKRKITPTKDIRGKEKRSKNHESMNTLLQRNIQVEERTTLRYERSCS